MKHPNRYWQLSRLLFSVLIVLAFISLLSSKFPSLVRLDYFSDIKPIENIPQLEDIKSKININLAQHSEGDTMPKEANHHLDLFFDALENMRDSGGTVHIAYFGDSQIEGDLLTADLRSSLQKNIAMGMLAHSTLGATSYRNQYHL